MSFVIEFKLIFCLNTLSLFISGFISVLNTLILRTLKRILNDFIHSPFHSVGEVSTLLVAFTYVLIAINSGWGFFGVIKAPDFWFAFLFTLLLTTAFTIYAHELYALLAAKYNTLNKIKLWACQLCFGLLLPVALELIMAEGFFTAKSESILTNSFFDIDFILVVGYIILVNLIYRFANKNRRNQLNILSKYKNKLSPTLQELSVLREQHRLDLMVQAPVSLREINLKDFLIDSNQIACFYKINDEVTIHYFNEMEVPSKLSISTLYQALNEIDYIKINPYCCYHRLLIFKYVKTAPSRRLYLTLRHPFNYLKHDHQRYVSQSISTHFEKWIDNRLFLSPND